MPRATGGGVPPLGTDPSRTHPRVRSFKSKAPKGVRLESLALLGLGSAPGLDAAIKHGAAVAKGALLTR